MTNTKTKTEARKLKKHPRVQELLDRMQKGPGLQGPQISTAFKDEILERLDCLVILPNMPKDENQMAQIQEWIASGEFSVQDLGNKLAELEDGPTCCGSNETGRLWSKAWFARITELEASTGYELKYSIFELWIAFTSYFTEEKKINTKDAEIAELKLKLEAARNA